MLFIYGATNFGTNAAFQLKMAFMVLAGLNALAFELAVRRSGGVWVAADRPPAIVKAFATLSLRVLALRRDDGPMDGLPVAAGAACTP